MGCANSKASKSRRFRHSGSMSPRRRSITLYPTYHLDGGGGGGVVARASASFVEVRREGIVRNGFEVEERKDGQVVCEKSGVEEKSNNKDQFDAGINEAKVWSGLMDERIPKVVPKTPIRTPPGEPENINLWEVMDGLEDTSPLIRPGAPHCKSFSFDIARNPVADHDSLEFAFKNCVIEPHDTGQLAPSGFSGLNGTDLSEREENGLGCTEPESEKRLPDEPKWLEMSSDEKASIPEFDPEIISMFRKSMENPSPENQFYIRSKASPTLTEDDEEQWQALAAKKTFHQSSKKDRVVVYFTSLRGIRKTYEDCCHVRVILKGLRVRVNEKDLSMHSGFKEELKELLGDSYGGGLPKVFIGNKYIGGADEIRRLNEEGELEKLVEGCEMADISSYGCYTSCEACGDIRFIPCESCSGSCKIFYDYDEDEEKTQDLADDGCGFHRCPDCNENGLIRCPLCCD